MGTMLGDALGRPFEGAVGDVRGQAERRADATLTFGYSDDTEMMIAIAESLLGSERFEPELAARALAARHEPARGYGRGMNRFVRAVLDGMPAADP